MPIKRVVSRKQQLSTATYNAHPTHEESARLLNETGVVVVPFLSSVELEAARAQFCETLESFPEFLPGTERFVLGGFGALGNPASFHNPLVRRLRVLATERLAPMLGAAFPGYFISQLFDRMLHRPIGTGPTAEKWHRDITADIGDGNCILGGWVNLGTEREQFIHSPRTHRDATSATGFALENPPPHGGTQALVPPGYVVMFYQNILHRIAGGKATTVHQRLFLSWFVSPNPQPHRKWDAIIAEQGVASLPSAQIPPMYPRLAIVYSAQRKPMIEWSKRSFAPSLRTTLSQGESIVPRFMDSLAALGLTLYPEYTEEERLVFVPRVVL